MYKTFDKLLLSIFCGDTSTDYHKTRSSMTHKKKITHLRQLLPCYPIEHPRKFQIVFCLILLPVPQSGRQRLARRLVCLFPVSRPCLSGWGSQRGGVAPRGSASADRPSDGTARSACPTAVSRTRTPLVSPLATQVNREPEKKSNVTDKMTLFIHLYCVISLLTCCTTTGESTLQQCHQHFY